MRGGLWLRAVDVQDVAERDEPEPERRGRQLGYAAERYESEVLTRDCDCQPATVYSAAYPDGRLFSPEGCTPILIAGDAPDSITTTP
jgi:hypothetical protein